MCVKCREACRREIIERCTRAERATTTSGANKQHAETATATGYLQKNTPRSPGGSVTGILSARQTTAISLAPPPALLDSATILYVPAHSHTRTHEGRPSANGFSPSLALSLTRLRFLSVSVCVCVGAFVLVSEQAARWSFLFCARVRSVRFQLLTCLQACYRRLFVRPRSFVFRFSSRGGRQHQQQTKAQNASAKIHRAQCTKHKKYK